MGKRCDLCDRGSMKDASRSHSNIKTLKRQHPNLQGRKIDGATIRVCTKCIKTVKRDTAK